jgi:hypothetical protein
MSNNTINLSNNFNQINELNNRFGLDKIVTETYQTNNVKLESYSQKYEQITGLDITGQASKSRILNADNTLLARSTPNPQPSRVNINGFDQTILDAKNSYRSLNAGQKARVTADLKEFTKTSSYQNASPSDRKILQSHIGDALIYREQLKNSGSEARNAFTSLNGALNDVINGNVKVNVDNISNKAQYYNGTITLGRNATQVDIIGSSVTSQDFQKLGSNGNFASDISHEHKHFLNSKKNIKTTEDRFLDEFSAQLTGYRTIGRKVDSALIKEILNKMVVNAGSSSPYHSFQQRYNEGSTPNGSRKSENKFRNAIDTLWQTNRGYTAEQARQVLVNSGLSSTFLNTKRTD